MFPSSAESSSGMGQGLAFGCFDLLKGGDDQELIPP